MAQLGRWLCNPPTTECHTGRRHKHTSVINIAAVMMLAVAYENPTVWIAVGLFVCTTCGMWVFGCVICSVSSLGVRCWRAYIDHSVGFRVCLKPLPASRAWQLLPYSRNYHVKGADRTKQIWCAICMRILLYAILVVGSWATVGSLRLAGCAGQ